MKVHSNKLLNNTTFYHCITACEFSARKNYDLRKALIFICFDGFDVIDLCEKSRTRMTTKISLQSMLDEDETLSQTQMPEY